MVPITHLKTICWQKAVSFPYFCSLEGCNRQQRTAAKRVCLCANLQVSTYKVPCSSVIHRSGVGPILYTWTYLLNRLRRGGFGEKGCSSKQPQANPLPQIQFPPRAGLRPVSITSTFCPKARGFRLWQDLLKAAQPKRVTAFPPAPLPHAICDEVSEGAFAFPAALPLIISFPIMNLLGSNKLLPSHTLCVEEVWLYYGNRASKVGSFQTSVSLSFEQRVKYIES